MTTITWTSAMSGDWNTASNWSGGQVPAVGDDAVIDLPGAYQITVPDVTVNSLTFNDAAGELLVTGSLGVTSSTTIQAGTLAISQSVTLGSLTNAGTIVDDGSLTLDTSDGPSLARITGTGDLTANVAIDNSGSTLDLQSLSSLSIVRLNGTIDGGTIHNLHPSRLTLAGLQAGTSNTLTLDNVQIDGTLNVELFLGGTLITNSGLTFAGANGTGPGTLFYSGENTDPGMFQINGTQTFNNVMIEGAGGQMDVTGSLTLAGGATLFGEPQLHDVSINLLGTGSVDNLGTITGADIGIGVSAFSNGGLIEAIFLGMPAPGESTGISLFSDAIDNLASGTIVSFAGGIGFRSVDLANAGLIETMTGGTVATVEFFQSTVDNLAGGIIRSSVGTITFLQSTVDNSASATIQSSGGTIAFAASDNLTNDGTIANSGGSVDIAAVLNGSGTILVQDNGVVEIENAAGSAQALDFLGAGTLQLDQPTFVPSAINGFSPNDAIILGVSATAVSYTSGDLKMQLGGGQTFDLAITGSHALSDFIISTTSASTNITLTCFAAGTRLTTMRGMIPVEALREGDALLLADGTSLPMVWLGHRVVDCRHHPMPHQVWPVRIRANAFGRKQPRADLWLSPDHAVFIGGVLIPVKYLINDNSIAQLPRDEASYYHVQLPCHSVLLAEGLPVESYLDVGDRSNFINGDGPIAFYPDFAARVWEADGCAPLVVAGPKLDAARRWLDTVTGDVPGIAKTPNRELRTADAA